MSEFKELLERLETELLDCLSYCPNLCVHRRCDRKRKTLSDLRSALAQLNEGKEFVWAPWQAPFEYREDQRVIRDASGKLIASVFIGHPVGHHLCALMNEEGELK